MVNKTSHPKVHKNILEPKGYKIALLWVIQWLSHV